MRKTLASHALLTNALDESSIAFVNNRLASFHRK